MAIYSVTGLCSEYLEDGVLIRTTGVLQLSVPPRAIRVPSDLYLKMAFGDRKVAIVAGSIICLIQECGTGNNWIGITLTLLVRSLQSANVFAHNNRQPLFITLPELKESLDYLRDYSCIILHEESGATADPSIDTITVTEEMIKVLAPYLTLPR